MKPQKPITASEFFTNVADLLQKGTFSWSCFEDVFASVNTLRQLSAAEKQREKAIKKEGDETSTPLTKEHVEAMAEKAIAEAKE